MGIVVKVGDKIKMDGEKQRYTVQGVRDRFVLATRPFKAKRTYLYTLIDTRDYVRGPLNSIFDIFNDVDSPEGATQLFDCIEAEGGWEVWHVSHRHCKALSAAEIVQLVSP
jgi:hypothetical protein